jgi:capsular polysaccharide biosynthesis protein
MTSSNTARVLLVRWRITVPGLILSLAVAAVAFGLVPARYTSGGTAVLVQPKQPGSTSSTNPLLTFDPSLNTTAMIVVQVLNAPQVATELGLNPDEDSFTVKNAGSVAVTDGVEQPFISITAQSLEPARSQDIVDRVMAKAQQELTDRQNALRVSERSSIIMESVVDATPPKPVLGVPLAASAVSFLLGTAVTTIIAIGWDRRLARRRRRRDARDHQVGKTIDLAIIPWSPARSTYTQMAHPPGSPPLSGQPPSSQTPSNQTQYRSLADEL